MTRGPRWSGHRCRERSAPPRSRRTVSSVGRSSVTPTATPCCGSTARPAPASRCRPTVHEVALAARLPGHRRRTSRAPGGPPTTATTGSPSSVPTSRRWSTRWASTGSPWSGCRAVVRTPWPWPATCPTGWWSASLLGGLGPVRGPDAVLSYTRLLRFAAPPLEVLRTPDRQRRCGRRCGWRPPVADPVFDLYAAVLGLRRPAGAGPPAVQGHVPARPDHRRATCAPPRTTWRCSPATGGSSSTRSPSRWSSGTGWPT